MSQICGMLKNLWYNFYNKYVRGLDFKTKMIIGGVFVLLSIVIFILSTKGNNKTQMVNSWFLFWLSIILFIIGLLYLVFL